MEPDPLMGPTTGQQRVQPPVVGPALDPSPAAVGPVIEEGSLQASAHRSSSGTFSPAAADAALDSSAPASSTSSPYDNTALTRASEGAFSLMGDSSHALSLGGHSSILDLAAAAAAAARVHSSHSPRSLPLSGAPPVPAPGGGATGGSTLSSSGAGPDFGSALALILMLILGAKFLRYARDSLKPDSIYGLIVNQPG